MHGYLRAVGFKKIMNKKSLRMMLNQVIESPTGKKSVTLSNGENIVEMKKEFGEGIGVLVHGYYDETDQFVMEYYIPYAESSCEWLMDDITITRHLNRESFAGVCEDLRMGVTIIYYLSNGMDYVERALRGQKPSFEANIRMSALSNHGMILLPINKNERQKQKSKQAVLNRKRLITEARNGDEAAIENLTIEDLDTYTELSQRLRREDIFSIVDTSLMPYGVECDQYTIIAEILETRQLINSYSGEKVHMLIVECNDYTFNVAINQSDLIGEPAVGMRFKGSIWLQGNIQFLD